MRQITLEVPEGTTAVGVFVNFKNRIPAKLNSPLIQTTHCLIDANKFSGARIYEDGNISYMIRLERKSKTSD